jgi:hypothetical protein
MHETWRSAWPIEVPSRLMRTELCGTMSFAHVKKTYMVKFQHSKFIVRWLLIFCTSWSCRKKWMKEWVSEWLTDWLIDGLMDWFNEQMNK